MTDERREFARSGWLDGLYGRVTQARRRWYARRPERRRRLDHPVISVGNLIAGGSGKTPVVAELARLLRDRGERPAILSRGYGRRDRVEGVLVVSDGERVLEPVSRSGDEPQLLAQSLPGVPVLVSADRYLAGAFGARQLGVTVSILDDGFQHVQLERDVDLLLVSADDLRQRVLPFGLLREPIAAAGFADALLVAGAVDDVMPVARALGHETAFRTEPRYLPVRLVATGEPVTPPSPCGGGRVMAIAGIARPQRFFTALSSLGWHVVREMIFPDHHWFSAQDVEAIQQSARNCGASVVITTEKDAVRLPAGDGSIPVAVLPMTVGIEPGAVFESWLLGRLRLRASGARSDAGGAQPG